MNSQTCYNLAEQPQLPTQQPPGSQQQPSSHDELSRPVSARVAHAQQLPPPSSLRVVVAGGPMCGKTTEAQRIATLMGLEAVHTDVFQGLAWSDQSNTVADLFKRSGPWVVEGTAAVRGLRKALNASPLEKPCDVVVWAGDPAAPSPAPQAAGHASMLKGCRTVWAQVESRLRALGVQVASAGQLSPGPAYTGGQEQPTGTPAFQAQPGGRTGSVSLFTDPASADTVLAVPDGPQYSLPAHIQAPPLSPLPPFSGEPGGLEVYARFQKRILTFQEQRAAVLLAEGLKLSDVSALVGMPKPQLEALRKDGDWMDMLEQCTAEFRVHAMSYGIARREVRVAAANRRHELLEQVIEERARMADPGSVFHVPGAESVPGVSTGLFAVSRKSVGSGFSQEIVDEYRVDGELLKQLSDLEESAAKELGHRVARSEVTVSGKAYIGVNVDMV